MDTRLYIFCRVPQPIPHTNLLHSQSVGANFIVAMSATQPKIDSKLPPVDKIGVASGKGQCISPDQGRPGAGHRVGLPMVSIDDDGINSPRSVMTPSVSRDRAVPILSTMILKLRTAQLADMLDEILAFLLAHESSSFVTGLLAVTEITHCFEGKLVFEGESELLKAMMDRLEASDRFHDIKGHGPRWHRPAPRHVRGGRPRLDAVQNVQDGPL